MGEWLREIMAGKINALREENEQLKETLKVYKCKMEGKMEIINKDKLPKEFIEAEIKQYEEEVNRKVRKAQFVDLGNGECKETFWVYPVNFERIRRITGYLVGTLDRWNNAKQAEEKDRVKHI